MLRAEVGGAVEEGKEEGKWAMPLGVLGELAVVKEEDETTDTLEIFLVRWFRMVVVAEDWTLPALPMPLSSVCGVASSCMLFMGVWP